MKKGKIILPILAFQLALCLFMNWGGDRLVSHMNWPVWLDSTGTVLCAYLLGPYCGAVLGATSSLLMHILYGVNPLFALVSIVIALIVGFAARKKVLETMLGTLTTSAIVAASSAVAAYPINMIFNGGSTGSNWGDAVIGFLEELGLDRWLTLLIGELYMELLDKLLILIVVFLVIRILSFIRKRKAPGDTEEEEEAKEEEKTAETEKKEKPEDGTAGKQAAGALALLLAAGLCLHGFTGTARAAEEATEEVDYNNYVQTVYASTNGLPCGESNAIAQTRDGIMWIGTYAGLYRYNGREFRWMDGYDSIRNVNCLYVDEEGRLWVGTNDNGLSILINEQVSNVIDQSSGLPANSVKSIIRSADGYYYIGTTGAMQILTLNYGLRRLSTLNEITYADHSAADDTGHVAAVTTDGRLFLLREGKILCSRQLTGSQAVYKSCTFDPDGYLLAATTENQIYRYDISQGWFDEKDMFDCQTLKSIKNLHYLDSGELFICADNGIGYIDHGAFEKINTNDFNNSIDNMLMDYQGNLWFTSSRLGLLRLAPSDFRDIYSTVGMNSRVVNTVVRWADAYYFGTDKGLDAVDLKGKHRVENELTGRFAGIRIRCMLVDSSDNLWVCTYGSGLYEFGRDGTEYAYNKENGAFGNRARVVTQLRDGTILAAGDTGLSFIRDHQVEDTILYSEGGISSMVLTIAELPDGTILAGTDGNGIAVIWNRQVTEMLTRANGLSSEVILRLVPDGKTNGVFVVTSNGLCYREPGGSIHPLENFPYFNNYDIWIKGTDDLFVLSSAGIYTVNRENLLDDKEEINYDLLDSRRGLNSSLTANAWTWYSEETGELYLPCDTGVFVLNTNNFGNGVRDFRMSVPVIRMDGKAQRIDRQTTTRIPRGVNRIELVPEVVNYSIQEPSVSYILEGFDKDWTTVPQDALNTIVYTNLPAGDYTFRLAVLDNFKEKGATKAEKDSHVLKDRTYHLTKEREMYDNNWFIFYLLSVPMFTVGWVTWLLVKRHERKMQEQLEQANRQIEMGKQTVIAIARTVDAKDPRTSEHSKRVAIYSKQMAHEFGLDTKQCQDIEWAAQMHDIGKIAIPDNILNKPSRLTDEEYAKMKSHTTHGAEILKDFTLLDNVIDGAQYHHERYDGRGYPQGLAGENIPLFARIIGVADAFDAMTANRVYRQKMDFSYVLGEMERGRGTQFDPVFVDILLKLINDGKIDLNKIYHVSREDSERAEKEAAEAKAERERAAAATEEQKKAAEAEREQQKPVETGEKQKKAAEAGSAGETSGQEDSGKGEGK